MTLAKLSNTSQQTEPRVMKAVVCNEYGSLKSLTLQDVDNPEPKDDELLLRVLAAGINFPDGLLVQGLY